MAFQLDLPKDWAADASPAQGQDLRDGGVRDQAGRSRSNRSARPADKACRQGLPRGVALMDSGYGHDAHLRPGMTELGVRYVAGVRSDTLVFTPGHEPPAGHTRPRSARRQRHVVSIEEVARGLPAEAWRTLGWREGVAERLSGRFARVRVVSAHRHRTPPERLLAE